MEPLSDTSAEARERLLAHWRAASPEDRYREVVRLNRMVRSLAQGRPGSEVPERHARGATAALGVAVDPPRRNDPLVGMGPRGPRPLMEDDPLAVAAAFGAALERVGAAWAVTAEDALLAKLRWYRLGGDRSDRQWRDILGIVAFQRESLDGDYLTRWSTQLGVHDLLPRALADTCGGV